MIRLKSGILFFWLLFSGFCLGQEYRWELEKEFTQAEIESWDINALGEIFIFSQGTLSKLDTDFNLLFTQSERKFGNISKIDARHSLKTLLFSEDQQMVGIVDNTLSFQEGTVDLAELGVNYATLVCYSNQSNRFWVYDEQNSRLLRLEGITATQKQSEISNLSAITLSENPTSLQVRNNQLLLFYENVGVFIFDYYGSLLRTYNLPQAKQVFPIEYFLYVMTLEKMIRIDLQSGNKIEIQLPVNKFDDFRIINQFVYFKEKSGIKKFSLIQTD